MRHVWTHPGNHRRRARALLRLVGWQLWQRTTRRPLKIRVGPTSARIWCHPHSASASSVLYTGLPDHAEMMFLLAWLRPDDTFADVGANIGVYSMLAGSIDRVAVRAFEPSAVTIPRLVENIALNGWQSRVSVVESAVGREPGMVQITVGHDVMNKIVDETAGVETETVPVTSLDVSLASVPVAAIKIDVEGFELDVLAGAVEVLRRDGPALLVEANDRAGLQAFLAEAGYTTITFDPRSTTIEPIDIATSPALNVIAVADLEAARARLSE